MAPRVLALVLALVAVLSECSAPPGVEPPAELAQIHAVDSYAHGAARPVAWGQVRIHGGFWGPVRDRSRDQGVPALLHQLEQAGAVDNFRFVAAGTERSRRFSDAGSDRRVYQVLEALGLYAAESGRAASLHAGLAKTVLAAQRADGYLGTDSERLTPEPGQDPTVRALDRLELRNAAGFARAAVAHFYATADRRLLEAAIRFADWVLAGVAEPAEAALEPSLVELYRVTGDRRFLDLVRRELRKYGVLDGQPAGQPRGAANSAPPGPLLAAAAADLYLETGDAAAWAAVERFGRAALVNRGPEGAPSSTPPGGASPRPPIDAPDEATCEALSRVSLNHRVLLATGDLRYADAMAGALYDHVAPGETLCPLAAHRLLAALPLYIYTVDSDGVQVNLFVASDLAHRFWDGAVLRLEQRTEYPAGDRVIFRLALSADTRFELALRVPPWADGTTVSVNGERVPGRPTAGRYLRLGGVGGWWHDGDTVQLDLPPLPRVEPGAVRNEPPGGS